MSVAPLPLTPADKLAALRRIDGFRQWHSLDDKRQCLQCGKVVTGRQIEVVGGTRGLGPLRMQCPTPNCRAIAIDMALPRKSAPAVRATGVDAIPQHPVAVQSGDGGRESRGFALLRMLRFPHFSLSR
jgi:hypothetical protein